MQIRQPSFFTAPDFWKTTWEEVNPFLDGLQRGRVWEIGRSHSGHPLRAVAYGEAEALHHHTGALPLLFEFPHGLEMKPFTFDEILDVGLGLFEEVMRYGVSCRYRPR